MTPLAVVICTLNEELSIDRCLASVGWAAEVVVVDSGSTDNTRERAAAHGARVVEQPWLGFSAQKNIGARAARHDWILSLDADEVVSRELAAALQDLLTAPIAPDPLLAFAVDRRSDFLGALLPNNARRAKRRGFVRLYHRRTAWWDEQMAVHEVVRSSGPVRDLPGVLLHWNDYELDALIGLFNRYASVEATELRRPGRPSPAVKAIMWPVLRFGWHYVLRREYRLGGRGLIHAGLKASSDFMRYAKLWEHDLEPLPRPAALEAHDAPAACQPHG